ncbi:MAG: hypothetical protein RLZZ230_962 [Candidatus Parcubacteria bacterium]|jgi:zinc protease
MHYHIDRKINYSLATITEPDLAIVSAIISVDLHDSNSVTKQTMELMYPEALLSGAGTFKRAEFLDAVNTLGASIDVGIGDGMLAISVRSTAQVFNKVLRLVEILLLEPMFPKSELKRIRDTVVNELHEHKENSKALALEALRNEFYGAADRKYSYDIASSTKAVDGVTMSALKTWHDVILNRNWTCSLAGSDDAAKAFEKMIAKCKKGREVIVLAGAHEQKVVKKKVSLANIPSRQNIDFSIGAPIPFTLHHPDYVPLAFALTVLGKWGGFTGRLMSTVREKEGLTYGIYAGLEGFTGSEQGYWRIMTFFAPDKTMQGLTSTFREVSNIYKHGITEEEFDKFKNILSTGQTLLQDSIMSLLRDLHSYHVHGFTLEEMAEHKNKINTVTLREVNAAAKTYLNPANLVVSGAGPINAVKKDIEKFVKGV